MGDENTIEITSGQVSYNTTGAPDIALDDDGDLQIYPVGCQPGAQVMFISVADWRALNAAVEAVIARGPDGARTADEGGGVIPLRPRARS